MPKDSIIEHETHVKAGAFVVTAHGSSDDVRTTKDTLAAAKHRGINEHSCCA